ncbi:hypothetical protein DAI22_04g187150 [Oryza sativa Japonica Group]|nr:hypothetical protein DAI22_04g187150 [Oryza sativa Japonica Group]
MATGRWKGAIDAIVLPRRPLCFAHSARSVDRWAGLGDSVLRGAWSVELFSWLRRALHDHGSNFWGAVRFRQQDLLQDSGLQPPFFLMIVD